MRNIGIHLRLTSNITDLFTRATELQLPLFQCFLVDKNGRLFDISAQDIAQCLNTLDGTSLQRYIHASYWTNLSGVSSVGRHVLTKEMELAQRLGFTHVVVHPGSAKGARNRIEGIDYLARSVNALLYKQPSMTLVLENVAHGNMTVGGDLHDFKLLLNKIDKPEFLKFCIDTAHAHSYGYDLVDQSNQEKFIQLIGQTVGFEHVALIHLNDTYEKKGSKIDRHATLGQGTMGIEALQRFALHPSLKSIPLLMELPIIDNEEEKLVLNQVQNWHRQ